MATEVDRLVTLLEARITAYEKELKRSTQVANRSARSIEQRFGQMNSTLERQFAASARSIGAGVGKINGLLGAIGVGLSVRALKDLTVDALNAVGGLGELSSQLGIATETIQTLTFAGTQFGVSSSEIETGLARLTKTVGEAAEGNKQAIETFERLNVKILDAAGNVRSTDDIFRDVIDAISQIEDPARRAALGAELMGRQFQKLLPIVEGGASGFDRLRKQAEEMGLIFSQETIAKADEAADKIAALSLVLTTQLQAALVELAPFLTAAAETALQFSKNLNQAIDNSRIARMQRLNEEIADVQARLAAGETNGSWLDQLFGLGGPDADLNVRLRELFEERNRLLAKMPAPRVKDDDVVATRPPSTGVSNPPPKQTGESDDDKRFKELLRELDVIGKQREATRQRIAEEEFGIQQQQLKLQGKEREAAIEEVIRRARSDDPGITDGEIERLRTLVGLRYDLLQSLTDEEQKKKNIEDADKRLNDLMTLRSALQEQLSVFVEQGNADKVKETEAVIAGVNTQIALAIDGFIAYWQAVGGPEADAAIAKLQAVKLNLENTGQTSAITGSQINNMLASGGAAGFDQFAQSIANGEDAVKSLGQAFQQFAADFLRQIAQMILQQALLNALQAATGTAGASGGGGAGGAIAGIIGSIFGSTFHSGGVARRGGPGRRVPAAAFIGARRLHAGNVPGLKSDEVAAILQKGEPVISLPQLRKASQAPAAGNGAAPAEVAVKVVNAFDSGSVMSEALSTPVGEKAFVNFVRANATAINGALNRNPGAQT